MNKPLSFVFGVLALAYVHTACGQDTVKKAEKPITTTAPAKPVIKPVVKPAPYGYKPAVTNPVPATTTPAIPVVADNSLSGLYSQVLKGTYRYQQDPIIAFHKSYMDTLNTERRKLKDAQSKLAVQAKTIASLQGDVSSKDRILSDSQTQVDTVGFLGIPLSKSLYNVIMWGLVLILGGGLAAVIYLSASSRREAAYRIQLHDELTTEFAAYKAKANEKEKKLARELQTERNKLDELMGK